MNNETTYKPANLHLAEFLTFQIFSIIDPGRIHRGETVPMKFWIYINLVLSGIFIWLIKLVEGYGRIQIFHEINLTFQTKSSVESKA